jgi:sirohydrochlorin cobaltochelatase
MMKEAILLVGHGSRDPEGNEEFLSFAERAREVFPNRVVEPCFIELADPTIQMGIDRCVTQGASRIVALPITLFAAGHVKVEIPAVLDAAQTRYPHVTFSYSRHLGIHPLILDVLEERIAEVEAQYAPCPREETAILLVGRGSSDPDANGDIYKVARLLWERWPCKTVEVCFIGVTFPNFQEGIARAVALAPRRVIVLPYFLFTGVLIQRMRRFTEEAKVLYPQTEFVFAEYLKGHPNLLKVLQERESEAIRGEAVMNCHLCKYRLAFSQDGHHHDHPHSHDRHPHHEQKVTLSVPLNVTTKSATPRP